jgi:hypothetical protein
MVCILLRVSKSRMKWAEQVAHMGEMRNAYIILVGKPKRRDQLENLSTGQRIISKWILGMLGLGGVDWIHLVQDKDW